MPRTPITQKQAPELMEPAERHRAALKAAPAPKALPAAASADERQPGDDFQPVDYESQDG